MSCGYEIDVFHKLQSNDIMNENFPLLKKKKETNFESLLIPIHLSHDLVMLDGKTSL